MESFKDMKPVLDHQVKFLKFCGINEIVSAQWKDIIRFYRYFLLFSTLFTIAMVVSFASKNVDNVLEIAECIAPLVSAVFMVIKFAYLLICSDKIYKMIKEIEAMNEECEFNLSCIFYQKFLYLTLIIFIQGKIPNISWKL